MLLRRALFLLALLLALLALAPLIREGVGNARASGGPQDPRLEGAYRFDQGGWIYVHLEGAPAKIGFAHGYLLAPEIADALAAV
ncbi:MAG TPA: hypothetical protein VLO07_06820, partial [Thermoanaerobaculia bacterium]|nr:hypothetical protein [Thermoanaerobaculia bacterium]